MEKSKINAFIKQLSKDTLNNTIYWDYLSSLDTVSEESNPNVFLLLQQNEFRQIEFSNSYYGIVKNGTIYLIYEKTESGYDGTRISGYKMYLQSEESGEISNLVCEQSSIYQLLNSIHLSLTKREKNAIQFIDDYLNSHTQN